MNFLSLQYMMIAVVVMRTDFASLRVLHFPQSVEFLALCWQENCNAALIW